MPGALPDGVASPEHHDAGARPLRVLVVAHDFPPAASPQSLRTARLVDGLLHAGFEVRVLAAPPPAGTAANAIDLPRHGMLTVTRCAGHMFERALIGLHRHRSRGARDASAGRATVKADGLNWKGRAITRMRSLFGALAYPGLSRSWAANAAPPLRRLLREFQPDRVVLCHEPAAALLLAPIVQAAGVPWIAELGDPVCADYTPPRWRARAGALQARVCADAAHVVLSSRATLEQLVRDSALDPRKASVLHQGFDPSEVPASVVPAPGATLRLVYTGRFYRFRDPAALYAAVARTPGIELLVAQPPGEGMPMALPPNVVAMGELRHARALELQASADVLVNIGNTGLPQLPGKFFEYFGLPRPILHLSGSPSDEQAELLARLRRGWVVRNDADAIAAQLQVLLALHREGRLHAGLDLSAEPVAGYAWAQIARGFADIVAREYA